MCFIQMLIQKKKYDKKPISRFKRFLKTLIRKNTEKILYVSLSNLPKHSFDNTFTKTDTSLYGIFSEAY